MYPCSHNTLIDPSYGEMGRMDAFSNAFGPSRGNDWRVGRAQKRFDRVGRSNLRHLEADVHAGPHVQERKIGPDVVSAGWRSSCCMADMARSTKATPDFGGLQGIKKWLIGSGLALRMRRKRPFTRIAARREAPLHPYHAEQTFALAHFVSAAAPQA